LRERKRTRLGRVGIVERVRDPLSILDGSGTDKESVGGGIAVVNGKLFVTSGLGVVSGLDSKTGEEVWRTVTRTPMHSAPTAAGGRVFAVSDDNELFAFNAETGEVIWTYQGIVESARMLTAPSPAVVGDTVISGFASGELIALRVQNGSVLWQDALSSAGQLTPLASLNDIASGPVVDDGYVIASSQSGVTSAFDLRTGQRIWTQPAGSLNFPLLAGDFVYLALTDGRVICMSKTDGSVIWVTQLRSHKNIKKKKKRISYSGPIFVGERLLVMSSKGKAITLNPYDGTILDEFKIGGNVFVAPVIANETVFVMTNSAKLIAFR
jgi:outer membrane protein assembly factor BamB